MQTLETLKRSIRNADDLASVVRTMKTLAAVSIRQYETATESLSVYSRTIETGLKMVLSRLTDAATATTSVPQGTTVCRNDAFADKTTVPASARRMPSVAHGSINQGAMESQKPTLGVSGAIVFGSDQGMCGQFNEQIAHFTTASLSGKAGRDRQVNPVLCVGHRAADAVLNAGLQVERTFRQPGSAAGITSLVQDLLPAINKWREAYNIHRIQVFHNQRISASACRPHAMQLLPLHTSQLRHHNRKGAPTANRSLPSWSMDTEILFSRLVKQFLFVSLFRACAESLAGENASRIAAMQAAERNIRDRLHDLRADYATRRQTTITEELLDVVTGFEALNSE